jgi:hypothetical protein
MSREQILSLSDLQIQKVYVPEWKMDVHVRSLSGSERDQFEEANLIRERNRKSGMMNFDVRLANSRARLVSLTCCDEKGVRLFQDSDVEALGKKNSAALSLLYNVAASLSGITDEDLEDLLKN